MSGLPPGWEWTTIGDLRPEFQNGLSSRGDVGGSPTIVLRLADITGGQISLDSPRTLPVAEDSIEKYSAQYSDILIVRVNGSTDIVGRFVPCHVDNIVYCDHFIRLRLPSDVINYKYLTYLGGSHLVRSQIERSFVSTAGQKTVNQRHISSIRIPMAPLEEQERIVATIEEQFSRLEAGVTALGAVRQDLNRMRAAVLQAAVSGRMTSHDPTNGSGEELLEVILSERAKHLAEHSYPGSRHRPADPDTHALPLLPKGWTWASVDQLSTRVVDGVHKKPNYVSEGIPFVTVKNLTAGPGISFNKVNYITPEDHADFCRRSHPEFGDLLVSKDGTLGVIRAVRDRRPFSIFVSVALIKPVLAAMTDYLEVALSSPIVQRQMVPKGTGLQHIHLEDLRADCIPLPPLAEQKRIVMAVQSELSRLDYLEHIIDSQTVRAQTLRSSILTAAFSGRLTFQDAANEPASALLERIAAQPASRNGHRAKRGWKPQALQEEVTA